MVASIVLFSLAHSVMKKRSTPLIQQYVLYHERLEIQKRAQLSPIDVILRR